MLKHNCNYISKIQSESTISVIQIGMHYVTGSFIAQMKEYLWLVVPQGINSHQARRKFRGTHWKFATKLHTEENGFATLLLNNAWLALGKVPGPEAERAGCKDKSFSRVRTAKTLLAELDERKAISHSKEMQDGIGHGVQLNGAYSHCVPPFFFKSSKVNNQHLVALTSSLMS